MKTIVHFGAGNIGRSLVGQLFSKAGWEVVFVDAVERIVDALNARGRYDVVVKDTLPPDQPDRIEVTGVRGLRALDANAVAEAVASADLLGTAVGPAVLPKLAPCLAAGLARRDKPVSIVMCENLRNAAGIMREALAEHLPADFDLDARVGLVETSIGKMVPIMPAEVAAEDPLVVWAEAYNRIIADRRGFVDAPPDVPGLVLKDNVTAYVDRKLFIHNLGHTTAAFFGYLAGMQSIWQCMADHDLRNRARAAMWASAQALIARYPDEFDTANQTDHVEDLLRRFANRALNDSVYRVGRDLPRKLGPEDRCAGALGLTRSENIDPAPIRQAIAAGLCFRATDEQGKLYPADEQFHADLAEKGPERMLEAVCGLKRPEDNADLDAILDEYETLRS
jgi:mannitol-1-phosphate 5-dehydrogenase